jgi:hypothetical protein
VSIDALVTIAVSLATAFGIWMFRIDRICTRLESKLGEVSEWRQMTSRQIGSQATKLDNHAGRIARLEALGEHR